jgi:hypothetical protein
MADNVLGEGVVMSGSPNLEGALAGSGPGAEMMSGADVVIDGEPRATDGKAANIEEYYERLMAEEGETAGGGDGADPVDAPVETPAPEVGADDDKRYAEFGRSLERMFSQDPAGTLAHLAAQAQQDDPAVLEALKAKLGLSGPGEPEAEPFDPKTYEPASDMEAAVLQKWGVIDGLPAFQEAVQSDLATVALQARANQDLLQAVLAVTGHKLPVLDQGAVVAHMQTKRVDLATAYDAVYGQPLKAASEVARQVTKARPTTLRSGSGAVGSPPKAKSIMDVWARVNAESGQ